MIKPPNIFVEAEAAIADLRVKTGWLQGQANLLLGFIAHHPDDKKRFAEFAKAMSETTGANNTEARAVAVALLASGLSQFLPQDPSPPSGTQPSGGISAPASNVIQFPKRP